MSRNIIVSELYYPEQNATGFILTGIAEGLAEKDSVNVLCAQPCYNQRGIEAPKWEEHNGVAIRRCWSTTCDPRKTSGRLTNSASTSLSIGWCAMF